MNLDVPTIILSLLVIILGILHSRSLYVIKLSEINII